MPANLPPEFLEWQKKLSLAKEAEEKIEILKTMLGVCPKHKGTEKIQEELKKKIAKLKREKPKKVKREGIYVVKKEEAGQVLIVGPANAGKTSFLNFICGTNFKVQDYPFTTQIPQVGMAQFENIKIQIVDTPPLSKDFKPGWLKNLARQADLVLVLIDLTKEPEKNLEEILEILADWQIEKEKIFVLANKSELEGAQQNFDKLKQKFDKLKTRFEIKEFSTKTFSAEALKKEIFEALKIVRVYLKERNKKPDFSQPFILKKGEKLISLVEKLNKEWLKKFKGAKIFSNDLKSFRILGKNYLLKDGDIIQIIE